MKRPLYALIALAIGVALVKLFWLVVILAGVALLIRFTFQGFKSHSTPKDNKALWQKWDDK